MKSSTFEPGLKFLGLTGEKNFFSLHLWAKHFTLTFMTVSLHTGV